MKQIIVLILMLSLVGCVGALVPVVKIDELSPENKHAVSSMNIYNESQLGAAEYQIIDIVEGISCKNKMWDPAATKTDAINQAKYWASQRGADALMNIQCEHPRGTTTTYNCWESITCTAQAIKLRR